MVEPYGLPRLGVGAQRLVLADQAQAVAGAPAQIGEDPPGRQLVLQPAAVVVDELEQRRQPGVATDTVSPAGLRNAGKSQVSLMSP